MSWLRVAVVGAFCVLGTGSARTQGIDAAGQALQLLLQQRAASGQSGVIPGSTDQTVPSVQIYQPVNPETTQTAPPSRLEALYSSRAGRPLKQFGYDILGVPTAVSAAQVGGVLDNYVLGEGDEILVDLRGQENASYRLIVGRTGQITLPNLNPILAAGRPFSDFRADLERQVARAYLSSNVFVSVGQIHQVSVLVAGEVRAPGTRILSGLSTPLDAILLSGGIAKTGSLRNVALIRGNQTIPLDLYSLLLQGTLPDIGGLRNGDRIYIQPLHNTVAVSGYVRRPGIYELRDGQTALDANDLIQLAGGLEIGGSYRLSKLNLESDGSTRLISFTRGPVSNGEVLFVDTASDIALERVTLAGAVRLAGAYPRASSSSVGRLIRSSDDLSPDAYSTFALIARRDPRLNVRVLLPFSLVPIFAGGPDIALQNDDLLYVFRRSEIRLLAAAATGQQSASLTPAPSGNNNGTAGGGATAPTGNATPGAPGQLSNTPQAQAAQPAGVPVSALLAANGVTPDVISRTPNLASAITALGPNARIVGIDPSASGAAGVITPAGTGLVIPPAATATQSPNLATGTAANSQYLSSSPLSPEGQAPSLETIARILGVPVEALVRMATDHVVWVLDEVREPGAYVAAEGTTVAEMIQMAGGALRQADLSSVEVTSTEINPQSGTSRTIRTAYKGEVRDFQRVSLRPLDVIRLRPVFSDREDGRVTVSGQVRYPGTFDITRGERLSSVLERAGGLTETAYPYGAVFTRERAAVSEREGNQREARALSAEIASLATSPNPTDRDKVAFLTTLTQTVQSQPVLGRITVTADPALLRVHPEFDLILEPGDALVIPPRPATVTVTGEVLNSGSFQYQAGLDVRDYIAVAGGATQGADEERIFVVMPDGSARPVTENWLTFNNSNIIPPGSTVVVPRDLRPFDLQQFLRDASQITSQIALTAASLVVIGR